MPPAGDPQYHNKPQAVPCSGPVVTEQPPRPQQLADDHWDKYVGPMLSAHGTSDHILALCEFHYKSAWVHGYKHAVEDARG